MEPNGVAVMAKSPPQEGPYSVRKHQRLAGINPGQKTATPGGSFVDRMRNVLHKTAAAGYSAEKLASGGKSSSSGNGNAWGDTPNTAEMECIAQLERDAALRQGLENSIAMPAAPLHDDGQQAPPSAGPRQLTFSPSVLEPCVARSGSGRAQRRQLSHLGRTSLAASSLAAAAAGGGSSSRAEARNLPSTLPPHMHKVSIGAVRPPEEDSVALNEESRVDVKRQKVNSGAIEIKNQVKFNPLLQKQQLGTTGAAYDFLDSDDEIEGEIEGGEAAEISNEIATQAHPNNHTPPPLELRSYLSPDISEAILRIGGPEILYQWQAECLCRPGVLQGRNLVYCAPTSGGKSLVADIIFLRRFVETGRPGLLVLPFISLCNEKKSYWDTILQPLDREAREYYGPTSTSAPISPRTGIIVATLEKANHLITQLLEENALGMLSCVIIDELHMVGDEHRGYQLELMLTKLRFAGAAAFEEEELVENSGGGGGGGENMINNNLSLLNKQQEWLPVMGLEEGTQIIGMSATLPNVSIIAKWLGAELYITNFRPVPLCQFLKSGNLIKDESGAVVRTIPECTTRFNLPAKEVQAKDPDHVAFLTQETVGEGFSVLVFCATRSASEATATVLSQLLTVPERHISVKKDVLDTIASRYGLRHVHRASIAEQIGKLSSSHGRKLSSLVEHGVGYHHAGMEPEDKEFIELAFKCGAISVLCATSSLAAGVNLPARRVIFRHPYIGLPTNYLDAANYRQMRGRAGRAGIDTHGESFLVVLQKSTEKRLAALMHAEPAPVESCLTLEKCGMKRAMLEVVASGAVLSPSDVDRYIKCTLLAATSESEVVVHATKEALKWLGDKERQFIYWDKKTETFQPTAFGKATLGSGLPPELCLGIRSDISRARQSFVLTTELHLAYLCVPATDDKGINFQWHRFEFLLKQLSPSEKIVADKVGINMNYVMQKARNSNSYIGFSNNKSTSASASSLSSLSSLPEDAKLTQQQLQRQELAAAMSEQDRICQRFATALLLSDILQEMSDADVRAKYGLDRAVVLSLRDKACRHAGMLAVFCERLGWHDVELLVSKFQARVLYGVRPEVVCLMEIESVQAATARMLYKAGLRTPEAVAAVPDVQRVVAALSAGKINASDNGVLVQARRVIKNAKMLLERKAKKLKEDAAEALQLVEHLNQGVADINIGGHLIGGYNNAEQSMLGIAAPTHGTTVQHQQHQQQQYQHQYAGQQAQQALLIAPPVVPSPLNNSSGTTSSIPSGPPPPLSPDSWEFGRTSGLITLSTTQQVHALKKVLTESTKYTRFAFQFDVVSSNMTSMQQNSGATTSTSSGWSAMPGLPSAAVAGAAAGKSAVGKQQPQHQQAVYGGVALSWKENQAVYIPFTQDNPQLPLDQVLSELTELFTAPHLEKITFDLKSQLTAMHRGNTLLASSMFSKLAGVIAATAVDVRIAAFLLHPEVDGLADGAPFGSSSSSTSAQQYGKKRTNTYNAESLSASILGPLAVATATRSLPPPPVQQQSSRFNALLPLGGATSANSSSRSTITLPNTAARNVILLNACFPLLKRELQLKRLDDLFLNIEMPLVSVLASMQVAGVGFDPNALQKEIPVLRQRLIELESLAEQCLAAASTTTTTSTNATIGNNSNMAPIITTRAINLNSTTEVAQALYVTLQLAPPPSAKAGADGKALSTKGEALDELTAVYPNCTFPRIVSEYRTITKLLSMCIEMLNFCTLPPPPPPLPPSGGNGVGAISNGAVLPEIIPRIHATVNQTTSVTGRLSMESPNLQTVPKPFAFFISSSTAATTLSTTFSAPYVCSLRKSIVAPPGMVLLSADYKQLELRMMAHLSGDVLLQAMLRDTTVDPFTQLAATWLGKPSIAAVTPEDRARAKNICYALLYGMGAGKLAPELGLRGRTAEQDAENLKKSFLETFPGLQRWIQQVKIDITSKSNNDHSGGVVVAGVGSNEIRTLFGRLRRFPNNTMNQPCGGGGGGGIKNLGNTALNSMTQGSAADISKLGMLAVAHVIEKLNNTNSVGVGGGDGSGNRNKNKMIARLVLSIHDEFLLEVDARYVPQVAIELRSAMEGVFPRLSVPLPVKISIGRTSWGEMEELVI